MQNITFLSSQICFSLNNTNVYLQLYVTQILMYESSMCFAVLLYLQGDIWADLFFSIISTLSNFFFYQQDFPNYLLSYFIALSFPYPTLLFIRSLAISIIQSSHSPAPLLTKVSHTQSLPLYQRSVCIGKLQSCKLFSTVDLFCTLLKSQSSL